MAATSDSSSSPSSSGTDFADPNPSTDPDTSSDRVQSLLESLNLSQPSEVSDGSHTDFTGDDDDDDEEEEVEATNGEEEVEASSRGEHPVEMEAGEEPPSPTSSGYDGERGSSATYKADNASEGEIREANADREQHDEAAWLPGKRHVDEDDGSMSWRKRKKHFFVLSNSGKPIYSRYGDEHKLAGFSATLQAIISFVENGGDRVNLVKAGKHQVVFLVKGPIYLVCISCTDETYEYLRGQLDLLYGQMILILTNSIDRCFEKNAKFDMAPLLGGTDAVFSSLVHSFTWNPATFLHAYTCLPLPYALRQATGTILQDVCASGVLFALLMCRHKVVSLSGAQKASLHPDDLLLLSNFVMSSESFRTSESFSPICLPRYNPQAFLHAYVHFFDEDTYVILLTTRSEAFHHLKDCRIRIEAVLLKSNILSTVQRSIEEGGMRVEDLPIDRLLRQKQSSTSNQRQDTDVSVGTGGPFGLWHFMYRSIYLDQYVSSEFSPPVTSHRQQKSLYRAYQKLYASMHEKGLGPHKTQYRRDENYTLLCWVTPDFELYAAFDPLADKAMAIKICNQVCQRVKDVENEVFLQGASPFSW
ncbi:SAND family protein [Raphanus sativus]|uniref:Vacuolar fusion protein MON1 homolog n=1 Tax=Raphanus sativus TaxID=3726 RepID=A0A6J0JFC3_RAPSA|nr:vacuolar fusion protein MON1 homolog [Raphanus sativus]KAJ4891190.1 SAND family protein [Raphanus sativus]